MKRLLLAIILLLVNSAWAFCLDAITINKDKIYVIADVSKYLIQDESIVSATYNDNKKSVSIYGSRLGSTILHVWSSEKRRSYKVIVKRPEIVRRGSTGKGDLQPGFKFGISAGRKIGESESKITANRYEYISDYYVLDGYGNTNYGFMQSQIGYKVNKEAAGTARSVSSVKLSFQKESTKFTFGDQTLRYSEFVLPFQAIQGITYATKYGISNVNISYGANRYGWWGKDNYRDERPTQYFLGLNVLTPFDRDFSIGFATVMKSEKNLPRSLVLGLYGNYRLNKNIDTLGELAVNGRRLAGKIGLNYENSGFFINSAYRNASQGYKAVNDFISYNGIRGLYLNSGYKYNDYLTFSSSVDQYVDTQYDRNYNNQDINTTTYFNYNNWGFTHSLWRQNRGNFLGSGIGQGQNYELSYLAPVQKTRVYIKYTPSSFEENVSSNQDYSMSSSIAGFQYGLFAGASVVVEKQWNSRSGNRDSFSPQSLRAYLSMPQLRLATTPFYLDVYARYQDDYDTSFRVVQNYSLLRSRIEWRNAADQRIYLEGNIKNVNGDKDLSIDRRVTEYTFGMTMFLDSGVHLSTGYGKIKGSVFIDNDGDGVMSASETGFEGIKVRLSDGNVAVTDVNGAFSFNNVNGANVDIYIEPEVLRSEYIFTTLDRRTVYFNSNQDQSISFGLSSKSLVQGIVFLDQNNNNIYDPGEPLISGVRVQVKGVDACKSDENGAFIINSVPSGKQVFTVDMFTVPEDYSVYGSLSREINVNPGEKVQIYLPLRVYKY
ncbi:MAG TPA: hypothetical protein DCS13_13815 [Candidatus Margulisbacteria bacterium]|nr:MAG: hypothetical protein A2X43_04075 [Candidatus Margulisbacteria bacterium GWD2_39_127]HAR64535.1 hypothetical protein [Candidatus Margulisiibacteriota bacterium]